MSKSGLKTKVTIIGKLLEGGTSVENVVKILAVAPMAAWDVADTPQAQLPPGGMTEAVENIVELGPTEGIRYVADLEGRPTVKCIAHSYNEKAKKFLFTLRVNNRPENETYDCDCVVTGLGPLEVEWLESRLGRRGFRQK